MTAQEDGTNPRREKWYGWLVSAAPILVLGLTTAFRMDIRQALLWQILGWFGMAVLHASGPQVGSVRLILGWVLRGLILAVVVPVLGYVMGTAP